MARNSFTSKSGSARNSERSENLAERYRIVRSQSRLLAGEVTAAKLRTLPAEEFDGLRIETDEIASAITTVVTAVSEETKRRSGAGAKASS
jgi:hypothetical protein